MPAVCVSFSQNLKNGDPYAQFHAIRDKIPLTYEQSSRVFSKGSYEEASASVGIIMKRAFTLIELLVVIAIIAILAAILFPVFAQAKEAAKKTTAISGIKQYGTASAIYGSDSDDCFPLGFGARPDNTWGWNVVHPYPTGWFSDPGVWTLPGRLAMADTHAMNSIQPYVKNLQLSRVEGGNTYPGNAPDFTLPRLKAPGQQGLSYNGYLHGLSSTTIDLVSSVPLFTTGMGLANMEGRAITNPGLRCDRAATASGPATCTYKNSAADGVNGGAWFWTAPTGTKAATYSGGIVYARTDTSAKFIRLSSSGTGTQTNTNLFDPWSRYINGVPNGIRLCQSKAGEAYYACFYMPDSQWTRASFNAIVE